MFPLPRQGYNMTGNKSSLPNKEKGTNLELNLAILFVLPTLHLVLYQHCLVQLHLKNVYRVVQLHEESCSFLVVEFCQVPYVFHVPLALSGGEN